MDEVKYLSSLWTDLLPNRSRESYIIYLKTPSCSIANNSGWLCHFYKYLRTQSMNVVEVFTMNTTEFFSGLPLGYFGSAFLLCPGGFPKMSLWPSVISIVCESPSSLVTPDHNLQLSLLPCMPSLAFQHLLNRVSALCCKKVMREKGSIH